MQAGMLLWVCLGGAIGSGLRYLAGLGAARVLGLAFPYGTFVVNLLGSFVMGGLMVLANERQLFAAPLRLALTTGLMGGFTTYSSFAYESLQYLQQRAWLAAIGYVALTLCACLAACALGYAVGGRMPWLR